MIGMRRILLNLKCSSLSLICSVNAFEAQQTFDTHEIRQLNNLSLANCVTHKKTVENYTKFNFQSLSNGVPWENTLAVDVVVSVFDPQNKSKREKKVWKVFREIKFCQTTRKICKKIRVVNATSRPRMTKISATDFGSARRRLACTLHSMCNLDISRSDSDSIRLWFCQSWNETF